MTPVRETTTLNAICISDDLRARADRRGPVRLTVLSVHRSAANLVAADGTLVTIADARAGGLPGGILVRVAGVSGVDLRATGIAPGMPATITDERCDIGSGRLVIHLPGARPWSPRIARLDPTPWRERRIHARALAAEARASGGIETLEAGRAALLALGDAVAAEDVPATTHAMRRLIGFGPGLTPSGDDALAGVAAVLHATGHPCAGSLGAVLDDVDERTTVISAAMLRHAARGDVAERTHRLLSAVFAASPPAGALDAAIRETVAWGATSGSDLLSGVVVAADAVTSPRRTRVAA